MDERFQRVHRMSGLARPLDPAWRSNRAVLGLMPAGAVLAAARALVWPGPGTPRPLAAAPLGALAVLAAWALAREVSPDRHGAAFVSLGLGLAAFLTWPDASVLLAFTTMLAVRMVSRSTGVPPRVWDSAALLVLLAWSTGATGAAGVLLVGALAFALDGGLPGGRAHQWGFAALSLVFVGLEAPPRDPVPPGGGVASLGALPLAVVVLVSLLHLATARELRTVRSVGDVGGRPLDSARVRAGAAVALLLPLQLVPVLGDAGVRAGALAWASLAGTGLAALASSIAGRTPSRADVSGP